MFLNREPSLTPLRLHKVGLVLFISWVSTSFILHQIRFFSLKSGSSAFTIGSLCGVKEAVCVKYLAQDMANSNSPVNGGCKHYTTDSAQFCWDLCTSSGEQRCSCIPGSLLPWRFSRSTDDSREDWSHGCKESIKPSKDWALKDWSRLSFHWEGKGTFSEVAGALAQPPKWFSWLSVPWAHLSVAG